VNAPFSLKADSFELWALGFFGLWGLLLLLVELGGGDLAAALAVLIAGGMTVLALDTVRGNLKVV
jgi:hypothetical protein